MRYKLHLRSQDYMIIDEDIDVIQRTNDEGFQMNYIIQYVPQDADGLPDGMILKDDEIKEFKINISIDVFVNDEDDNELASLATYITTQAQVTIVNDEIQLNIKSFNINDEVKENYLDNYSDEADDDKLIKAIKELLSQTDLNATTLKQFMLKEAMSFSQLDD